MGDGADKYNRKGVKTSYISTIIGISLVLFLIGIVLVGVFGLNNVQRQAKESLECDLFFLPELNEADVKQVEQELKTWPQFKEVYFVSSDRALDYFQEGDQTSENIAEIFDGENPMPPTVSFKPKEKYATIEGLKEIEALLLEGYGDRLEDINYEEATVKAVNLGFKQLVYVIGVIALLLIVVAFAMINNTIRLALYSKRFSIKTMQLVGATRRYIRRPFLAQSIGMGVVSGTIGMALLIGLFFGVNNVIDSVELKFSFIPFVILFASLLLIGIVISFISTWFALNKYLRMKLDDLY
ncbi:MAG: permease-like cell division protein FtsX [Crocinitomicaceae bacterium]|nr:permease-like cell division protein FtsX [Crocinitomicaceae bacterium]